MRWICCEAGPRRTPQGFCIWEQAYSSTLTDSRPCRRVGASRLKEYLSTLKTCTFLRSCTYACSVNAILFCSTLDLRRVTASVHRVAPALRLACRLSSPEGRARQMAARLHHDDAGAGPLLCGSCIVASAGAAAYRRPRLRMRCATHIGPCCRTCRSGSPRSVPTQATLAPAG
jgi:hypothetical protein